MATSPTIAQIIVSQRAHDRPHAIYPSLRDKLVLVTGGAEGIGAAAVKLFLQQGSRVIILDIATTSIEDLTRHLLSQNLPAPIFYRCDVSSVSEVRACATQILSEHGAVNVLINNAAALTAASKAGTLSVTPESWNTDFDVNLRHQFFLSQALIPAMMASGQGGSIVNMGSISWRIPATGLPAYITAKAGVVGLTKTLAKEFGPFEIRVNSVMPGAIATERQIRDVLTDEYREQVMAAQSLKRDLLPVEVARVVVFLASDEASGVTGSTYTVDGGWVSDP